VAQFKELCSILNIDFQKAPKLTSDCGYISGFFSSDGSVFIDSNLSSAQKADKKNGVLINTVDRLIYGSSSKLILTITNTFLDNLKEIIPSFKKYLPSDPEIEFGRIRKTAPINKPHLKGVHRLIISEKQCILIFLNYLKKNSSLSIKYNRLNLITEYYELKQKKAHLLSKAKHFTK
jgi:hypothetical protein